MLNGESAIAPEREIRAIWTDLAATQDHVEFDAEPWLVAGVQVAVGPGEGLLEDLVGDRVDQFSEAACAQGSLGTFPAKESLSLAMAHAGRLMKFGA